MHGLVNRAMQCFVRDVYGPDVWAEIARRADLGFDNFEAMLHYDDAVSDRVIEEAARVLDKSREMLAEDFGTHLVAHPHNEALRRLLRFSGTTFIDFLQSLDDLADRVRLAVADLRLPRLELIEHGAGQFTLRMTGGPPGTGHVVVGLLRAIADDYGTLALAEHEGRRHSQEFIAITVHEAEFAEGRRFMLAAGAA